MKDLDAVKFTGEINSDGARSPSTSRPARAATAPAPSASATAPPRCWPRTAPTGSGPTRPSGGRTPPTRPTRSSRPSATSGSSTPTRTSRSSATSTPSSTTSSRTRSDAGKYKATGTDEVDGQEVVKVEQTDDEGTSAGYVLVEGDHYLLKLERTEGDEPGHLEFSDFDEEFDVEAPADDEVIDLSTIQ